MKYLGYEIEPRPEYGFGFTIAGYTPPGSYYATQEDAKTDIDAWMEVRKGNKLQCAYVAIFLGVAAGATAAAVPFAAIGLPLMAIGYWWNRDRE